MAASPRISASGQPQISEALIMPVFLLALDLADENLIVISRART